MTVPPGLTTTLITSLMAIVGLMPTVSPDVPGRLDVDCRAPGALERALAQAEKLGGADIVLHGVCEGHVRIASPGITLRGATRASGVAAPAGGGDRRPVVEVADVSTALRTMVVRGGSIGVLARGWDRDTLLYQVDLLDNGAGAIASRGATVRLLDGTVRNGTVGVEAQFNSALNLQRVTISGQDVAVSVFDSSTAALNDSTFEDNRGVGLFASRRSDVNSIGCTFRENGDAHVLASNRSDVTLLFPVAVGSDGDATEFSLLADDDATIQSYTTPVLHGSIGALNGASIRVGDTVVDGYVLIGVLSDAYLRNVEITEYLACFDGGNAICSPVTAPQIFDCPSSSCSPRASTAAAPAPTVPSLEHRPYPTPAPR